MSLHLAFGHHHRKTPEQHQEIREARRLLKERIKTDWDYPSLPQWHSSGIKQVLSEEDRVAGFRFHTPKAEDRQPQPNRRGEAADEKELDFEPVEWRERSYESSDPDDSAEDGSVATLGSKTSKTSKNSRPGKKGDKYRFEEPESVGPQVQQRRMARKRSIQRAMEEEVEWNDGMRHWMARRDAWCCARTSQPQSHATITPRRESSVHERRVPSSASASGGTSPRSSTSSTDAAETSSAATSENVSESLTSLTLRPALGSPFDVLVPVAPQMLPNHPIRSRITPHSYPEIYSKIIVQSRTPSVPINLRVLTTALVQGWIEDGEWPPKPNVLEQSFARRKSSGSKVKDGVKAVGRVLRITHSENVAG